jgi:hypothetical protein
MAYTLNGITLSPGRPFTGTDGTQYPGNWLTLNSDADKEAIGIVITADPADFDSRFYFGFDDENNLIPRQLLDETSGGITTEGLRTQYKKEQDQTAHDLLFPTDWYVIRNSETSDTIPVGIASFRSEVRTMSGNRGSMILATTDVGQLQSLVTGAGTSSIVGYTTTLLPNWPDLSDYT